MAGMRPFVLGEENASAYCNALAAADCPSSQIAIDKLSAVPLWKVIVGPAPTNCKPDSQESGFLFHPTRRFHPTTSSQHFHPTPTRAAMSHSHFRERLGGEFGEGPSGASEIPKRNLPWPHSTSVL